jgi:hypothetical protein
MSIDTTGYWTGPASCGGCGRVFKTNQALGCHEKWTQRNGSCAKGGDSAERSTVCERCGTDFGNARELQYHHQRRRAGRGMVCIDSRRLRERALEHMSKQQAE